MFLKTSHQSSASSFKEFKLFKVELLCGEVVRRSLHHIIMLLVMEGSALRLRISDESLVLESTYDPPHTPTLSIRFNHIVEISGTEVDNEVKIIYLCPLESDATPDLPAFHPCMEYLILSAHNAMLILQHPLLSTYYYQRRGQKVRHLDIITNGTSGHQKAGEYLTTSLLPLLRYVGVETRCHPTTGVEDARKVMRSMVAYMKEKERGEQDVESAIMIMGGHGTIQEVLNGLLIEAGNDNLDGQGLNNVNLIIL